MVRLTQTAFRLTDSDLAILDAAQSKIGLSTRVETLRFILRQWAESSGVEVPGEQRPRPRPKRK